MPPFCRAPAHAPGLMLVQIEQAKGGILFVDEAYRLVTACSEKDFGREALEEIMAALDFGTLVVILAGEGWYERQPGGERDSPWCTVQCLIHATEHVWLLVDADDDVQCSLFSALVSTGTEPF